MKGECGMKRIRICAVRCIGRLNVLIEVASGIAVFPGGVLTEKSYITCYFAEAGLRRIQISILMPVTAIIMWRYKKD